MIKTFKDLKIEYGKDLQGIKKYDDLKSLASNFIRMITWKKEKDLEYISNAYIGVICLLWLKLWWWETSTKKTKNEYIRIIKIEF